MVEITYVVRPTYHGKTYDERISYHDSLEEAMSTRERLKNRYEVIEVLKVEEEVENDQIVRRTITYF